MMSNRIFVIFCEEVRDEVIGSRTLVGVFPPEGLTVSELPFILPKFAFFIHSESLTPSDTILDVEIYDPSGKSLFKVKSPLLKPRGHVTFFSVNISPLQIKQQGNIKIKILRNDKLEVEESLMVSLNQAMFVPE